jgi:hypothetical protein
MGKIVILRELVGGRGASLYQNIDKDLPDYTASYPTIDLLVASGHLIRVIKEPLQPGTRVPAEEESILTALVPLCDCRRHLITPVSQCKS